MTIQEIVAKQYAIGYGKGEKAVIKTVPFQSQSVGIIVGTLKTEWSVVKAQYDEIVK
jgi:hypothetical protein